ncbi:MAG: cysteine desulfurase [Acidobacteriota bacterium]|nr:cysteine desulfurase [Acidobacteriota bacterium]
MQHFYFDHNATTPVAPDVLSAMTACMAEVYGNASSIHYFGQAAKQRLEQARRQISARIGCSPKEIVFVSGGTEADNLALLGTVRQSKRASRHMITSSIEHPAVLHTCGQLEREGVDVTYLPVGGSGVIDPDDARRALQSDTVLISIQHANNEIGTVQPISEIAAIAREAGVPFHSDGVQSPGRIPVNMTALGVDLYSISGHKMYAPKGIGALYVRDKTPLHCICFGGHHERERRPGTENVPGAVALGQAAESLACGDAALRDQLENGILARVPSASINARRSPRLPNTTNIRFEGIAGEPLVIALDLRGFAVSSGAACSSGAVEPSHVLTAIGLSREDARSCIRFSLGRSNTAEQIDQLIDAVADSVARLRKLSPMVHEYA